MNGEDGQARLPEDTHAVGGGTDRSQLCAVCLKYDQAGHRQRDVKPETAHNSTEVCAGRSREDESIPTSGDFSSTPITSSDTLCEQSECLYKVYMRYFQRLKSGIAIKATRGMVWRSQQSVGWHIRRKVERHVKSSEAAGSLLDKVSVDACS